MQFREKIKQLNGIICNVLMPLVDNDFVLFDLPYHANIGDVFIWEGELRFFGSIKDFKLLSFCNLSTYRYRTLQRETIIFLHGGGNFGDVWDTTHKFKEKVIRAYPKNKIIILPQTVWYNNKNIMLHDVDVFSRHTDLTICARDMKSYEILRKYFTKNSILLVPDMAFCISPDDLKEHLPSTVDRSLFLRRTDKELNAAFDYYTHFIENKIDIHDWPSMEKNTVIFFLLRCLLWENRTLGILPLNLANTYASLLFKPEIIKKGVSFIGKYKKIYTSRLHGAILSCLLEKPFVLFDNSYGKNRSFFETWLGDLDNAKLVYN